MKVLSKITFVIFFLGVLTGQSKASNNDSFSPEVNNYSEISNDVYDQSVSISQFTDVQPTDWAYSALENLVENYGCVAGYPNGAFKGGKPIGRYEAAALLNACLDQVVVTTEQINKLIKEFESELAIIRGRVDGLEARVGELEAIEFSTTTKLSGKAQFIFGATGYKGAGAKAVSSGKRNDFLPNNFGSGGFPTDAASFSYDLQLYLDTSFTGKDRLHARLEAANMRYNAFGLQSATPTAYYSWFFPISPDQSQNSLYINRFYYRFPLSDEFTAVIGPRVRQDDLLGTWPGLYPTDFPLFGMPIYAGSVGAYNLNIGPGASLIWNKPIGDANFLATVLYLAGNGHKSNPNEGGIATMNSGSQGSVQLALKGDAWNIAAAWTYNQPGIYMGMGTPLWNKPTADPNNSYGLGGYYMLNVHNEWLPILNAGAGFTTFGDDDPYDRQQAASWYVALTWPSVFAEGQDLGMSVGQPTFITNSSNGTPDDGGFFIDAYYKFPITDRIAITPVIQWASRPYGELTNQITGKDTFSYFAGLLKTSFRF